MALKKPAFRGDLIHVDPLLSDSAFTADYPTLTEYLTLQNYEDGSSRLTSTLLIFTDNGSLKLCLNDRETSRSCFMGGSTFEEAFSKLEDSLRDDTADWRVKRPFGQQGPRTPF